MSEPSVERPHVPRGIWQVLVDHQGKQHFGGLYDTEEEANEAARALREKLDEEFVRHE